MRESERQSQREQIRDILAENIDRLDSRIEKAWGEDMDAEAEQLQLTRLRTLADLTGEFRLLAHDEDIDEMEAEVDLLQEALEVKEGAP